MLTAKRVDQLKWYAAERSVPPISQPLPYEPMLPYGLAAEIAAVYVNLSPGSAITGPIGCCGTGGACATLGFVAEA